MVGQMANKLCRTREVAVLQCLDGVYGGNGKRQWTLEKNAIGHKRGRASSEQASSVNFRRKTRTVRQVETLGESYHGEVDPSVCFL
jgi:hypothetical protein